MVVVRPLTSALKKKAEEELNEFPARINTDVRMFREWVTKQPHLHSVNPSDQWLLAFLRGCKYNIEKAHRKLDMYYALKATIPEFYANRDPLEPGIQELLKIGVLLPLRRTVYDDSPKILLVRLGRFSQTARPMTDLVKVALMIVEILLQEDDNFTIAGEDIIIDCKDVTFSLALHFTPSLAKKLTSCSEKSLSIRLRSMHFLNSPFFIGPVIKLLKMFLGKKIEDRIHAHTEDCNMLYDHINKSVLPEELGGMDGTIQELTDHWKAKVESYRDWFLDESCSDESKRPKKASSGVFSSMMRPFQSSEIY